MNQTASLPSLCLSLVGFFYFSLDPEVLLDLWAAYDTASTGVCLAFSERVALL